MPTGYFSVPYYIELKDKSGWISQTEQKYYIFRCHYMYRERQTNEGIKQGEIIDTYNTVKGFKEEIQIEQEVEVTRCNVVETVKQSLVEHETVLEFINALSVNINPHVAIKLSNKLKTSLQKRLMMNFSRSLKFQSTDTIRYKEKITRKYSLDPKEFNLDESVLFVNTYVKYAWDICLRYVDYLFIEYKKPNALSLKLKRHKYPDSPEYISDIAQHPNIILCQIPLATFYFWKLLPSQRKIKEVDYQQEVVDPFEITVGPAQYKDSIPLNFKAGKPTLYYLSNKAFPLRR